MNSCSVSVACGTGLKRGNNEDNFCLNGMFLDETDVANTKHCIYEYNGNYNEGVLAAVCDGMGGEAAGEVASQLAVSMLAQVSAGSDEKAICTTLRDINALLVREAKKIGAVRIGCTAAVLSISESGAAVINVGDSRIYRLRRKKLKQLSRDQSEVQYLVEAGLLTPERARKHPMRHRILQFLGMQDTVPEFEKTKISDVCEGDVYVVCSDGVTDCIADDVIADMLISGADARDIYDMAMENGGSDNATIIIIKVIE